MDTNTFERVTSENPDKDQASNVASLAFGTRKKPGLDSLRNPISKVSVDRPLLHASNFERNDVAH